MTDDRFTAENYDPRVSDELGYIPDNPNRREPQYHAEFEPVYPCRIMPTRHCPAVYNTQCGIKPCARFEVTEDDVRDVWMAEIDER